MKSVVLSGCLGLLALGFLTQCRTVVETKPAFRPNITYEPPRTTGVRKAALPGRYVGFYRPTESEFKIPLVIDLIAEKTKGDITRYQAFARFSLGDFGSDEFRVEHYPQIVLNHTTGQISVDAANSQLEIVKARLKANSIVTGKILEQGQEKGDFLVIYSGNRRRIKVEELIAKVFPKRRLFPQVKGAYVGSCKEKLASFDVSNVRWFEKGGSSKGFLKHYKSQARLGIQNDGICGEAQLCAKTVYSETIVDIDSGVIGFRGKGDKRLDCTIANDEMQCGKSCKFSRNEEPNFAGIKSVLNRPERTDRLGFPRAGLIKRRIDFEGAVNGEYFGYLFNEKTLKHQFFRLKVDAEMIREPGMTKPSPVVAGVGTMFYGDGSNNEFSVNKFRGEFFSETGPQFVFAGDGDQTIQVTKWSREGMRAILYSKSFGRVGTLELMRQGIPELPDGADIVKQLTGVYAGPKNRFTVLAQPNVSESKGNFFPLLVRGYAQEATDLNKKILVRELSYDSYSGQFGMMLEDGRLVVGREANDGFELVWNKKFTFGTEYVQVGPAMFQFMKESLPGKTATSVLDAVHSTGTF